MIASRSYRAGCASPTSSCTEPIEQHNYFADIGQHLFYAMDTRKMSPEFTLELFADINNVRDVARGILHLIFFHRHFPLIRPSTIDVLDLALPFVPVPELESIIDSRCYQLYRQLSTPTASNSSRGSIQVQFLEKKRKPRAAAAGLGWFGTGRGAGTEEEVCWETWNLKVTLASPRTETEKVKALRAMETTLQKTALKIMAIANSQKEHIPAITNEQAFPYQILLNPRVEQWGMR